MGSDEWGDRVELTVIAGGTRWDEAPADAAVTVLPDPERSPAAEESADPPANTRLWAIMAAVALAIAAGVVLQSGADDDAAAPGTSVSATTPVTEPDFEPLSDPQALGTPPGRSEATEAIAPVAERSESIVGTVTWTRVDGDARALPARVELDAEGALAGRDDDHGWWRPAGDLSRWQGLQTLDREVGDDTWRLRKTDPTLGLAIVSPIGSQTIGLSDLLEPVPAGFVATIEPATEFADGLPIELGGEVFLLASSRVSLPWESIVTVAPDGAYRARLSDGDRSIRIADGRFNELPVEELTVVPGIGASRDVVDAAGEVVWSFEQPSGRTALEAASGRFEMSWLRWDGSRFAMIDRPWSDWHDVEMVRFAGGLLARSDGPLHEDVALWHSADGLSWSEVALPAERLDRTPVGLDGDGTEAIVTVFAQGGFRAWSTSDAAEFVQLADVPGVATRIPGDFGWVSADPRSAPVLRVSVDGEAWEGIDLRGLLDLDASRWDVSITAAARGDLIVVVADRGEERSVLVGEVDATG